MPRKILNPRFTKVSGRHCQQDHGKAIILPPPDDYEGRHRK